MNTLSLLGLLLVVLKAFGLISLSWTWVLATFWAASVCWLVCVLISVVTTEK